MLEKIIDKLLLCSEFNGYKFRKRDTSLIMKSSYGYELIEFQKWKNYDPSRKARALIIHPLYLKKFDLLHKWFEKFNVKTKLDARDNYSVGLDGSMLDKQDNFYFLLSEQDFDNDFSNLKAELIKNSNFVFKKYSNISGFYKHNVEPILNDEMEMPDVGADWIFI